jgi:hypothetical protein
MSPARATLLLGLAIAASAAACRDANHRRRPTPSFHSDELASRKIRRVVLAPFEDEARTGPARAAIQEAFAHEFEKATSVEVVAIDAMAHMEAAQDDRPRRTGQYHLESILELALRHDADGVLFGTITSYRAYAPQKLGIRVDLVSANSGLLLWSAHAEFDMADDDARFTLESDYKKYASKEPQALSWDHAMNSPGRFASLVSAEAVATLKTPR